MSNKVRRVGSFLGDSGYSSGLEGLAKRLGCTIEEARLFRMTIAEMFSVSTPEEDILEEMAYRGYDEVVSRSELDRCRHVGELLRSRIERGVIKKSEAMLVFRSMVMSCGDESILSKSEVGALLSSVALDVSKVTKDRLQSLDILSKLQGYYGVVDNNVRVVIEHRRVDDSRHGGGRHSGGKEEEEAVSVPNFTDGVDDPLENTPELSEELYSDSDIEDVEGLEIS